MYILVYCSKKEYCVKYPSIGTQFGLNKFEVGMMFLILSGVYVPLALVVGRLSDKLVSTQTYTVATLVHVY